MKSRKITTQAPATIPGQGSTALKPRCPFPQALPWRHWSLAALLLAVLLGTAAPMNSQVVVVMGPKIPQLGRAALAWADYDGDRDLDLFMCGLDSLGQPVSCLLQQAGSSMVPDLRTAFPCLTGGDAHWDDADQDGDADLVLQGWDARGSWRDLRMRNDGGGRFTEIHLSHACPPGRWSAGGWERESAKDILSRGMMQTRDDAAQAGTMARCERAAQALEDLELWDAQWTDFDADGQLDLIVTGWKGNARECRVYHWEAGTCVLFQGPNHMPRLSQAQLACGDYNGDGYTDFVIAGSDTNGKPRSYIAIYDPAFDMFEF